MGKKRKVNEKWFFIFQKSGRDGLQNNVNEMVYTVCPESLRPIYEKHIYWHFYIVSEFYPPQNIAPEERYTSVDAVTNHHNTFWSQIWECPAGRLLFSILFLPNPPPPHRSCSFSTNFNFWKIKKSQGAKSGNMEDQALTTYCSPGTFALNRLGGLGALSWWSTN